MADYDNSKIYISYNQIHSSIRDAVDRFAINDDFQPDLMIAIGGGGFIPARILRTFLKKRNNKNIPIQAIGLSLYEDLEAYNAQAAHAPPDLSSGAIPHIRKTQWLNFGGAESLTNLIGRRILIVDEVDDTRQTLAFAVEELVKDIKRQEEAAGLKPGEVETKLGIFVLHNKLKEKKMSLPDDVMKHYYSAVDMPDKWLVYAWDAVDIEEHTRRAGTK